MKKLLSLLTAVTLVGTGASSVVACQSQKDDQTEVNRLKNEIINTVLVLPVGTNKDTSNTKTIDAIRAQINSNNPKAKFKDSELKEITFSKVTLPTTQPTKPNVDATITVGKATATVKLTVSIGSSDQDQVNAIANKITNKNITVPINSNTSTKDPSTITALKNSLKKENSTLTSGDLAQITFADITLTNTPQDLKATITKNAATAIVTLKADLNHLKHIDASGPLKNASIMVAPVKIGDAYYLSTRGKGLWASTNGTTWTQNGITGLSDSAQLYSAPVKIGDTFYIGTYTKGLYTSADGKTWTQTSDRTLKNARIEIAPVKVGGTYYLATYDKGLYTSANGTSWTPILETQSFNIKSININTSGLSFLTTRYHGVWTSINPGTFWTPTTINPLKIADIISPPVKIGGTYYLSTNGKGLWTSTDGKAWNQTGITGLSDSAKLNSPPVKLGDTYYIGDFGTGLWQSTDGKVWNQNQINIPAGLKGIQIQNAPVEINGNYFATTHGSGVWVSSNKGSTWVKNAELTTAVVDQTPQLVDGIYYFSTYTQGLWTFKSI